MSRAAVTNAAMDTPIARSSMGALAGLSLSMLASSLGTSVANVALPTLARAFAAPFQEVQWIVLSYLLGVTVPIVGVGRLGDLVGRRRLLLSGIVLFIAASVSCGVSTSLSVLALSRAFQGLGAAVMMALTIAFVGDTVPKARTGAAMGLLGTMSAVGTALGPSLGGACLSLFGWRAIFFANLPLGLVTLLLAHRSLPADRRVPRGVRAGFDTSGSLLLAVALGAFALAMTTGRGHFGALNAAWLFAALASGALFVKIERRAPAPLIRLSIFRDSVTSAGLAMSAIVSTVMMATLVVGPFYLARGLGLDVALVGVSMSAGPVVSAITGVPAGLLVDRLGERSVTRLGLGAMVLGAAVLAFAPLRPGVVAYVVPIVILTAGYALFQAANNTAIMAHAGPDQRGVMAGMLGLSRNLGLITGASAMGALFASAAGASDLSSARPSDVVWGMRVTFAVAAVLGAAALALVRPTCDVRSWRGRGA